VTHRLLFRPRYLIAWLVVATAVAAVFLLFAGINFPARAQTPEPVSTAPGKPSESNVPAPVEPPTKNWGGVDETTIGADPVAECPLTAAGCEAVGRFLKQLETGDVDAVINAVPDRFPIGGKTGLQIADKAELKEALIAAREHLRTVAVGCPQETLLGSIDGACNEVFVLAIDAVPESAWTLGFVFVNHAATFVLDRAVVQPQLDLSKGGGSASIAIPYKGSDGGIALWYTPWQR